MTTVVMTYHRDEHGVLQVSVDTSFLKPTTCDQARQVVLEGASQLEAEVVMDEPKALGREQAAVVPEVAASTAGEEVPVEKQAVQPTVTVRTS